MDRNSENVLFSKKASAWFKGLAIIMVILSHYAEWWSWFYAEEGNREWIRLGISKFGPYGVAIFLLFSGYGLAKSSRDKRIGGQFILKRLLSVYVPYLIMVVLIELGSGGFESMEDIAEIWYGQDFWYMTVMFSFYIAFILIGLVFVNPHLRAICVTVFAVWYSIYLYNRGEYDFWYISNIAFALGVILAVYEPFIKKFTDKAGVILAIVFGIGSVYVVYSGVYVEHVWANPVDEIWSRIIAVLVFTLFIVFLAALWKWYDPVIRILGQYSLYLYLSHTFLFMWAINYFEFEMKMNFLIATGIILGVSLVLGAIITKVSNVVYGKIAGWMDNRADK